MTLLQRKNLRKQPDGADYGPKAQARGHKLRALMTLPLADLPWPKSLYSDSPAAIKELMATDTVPKIGRVNEDALRLWPQAAPSRERLACDRFRLAVWLYKEGGVACKPRPQESSYAPRQMSPWNRGESYEPFEPSDFWRPARPS
jgi:hypothetical protein